MGEVNAMVNSEDPGSRQEDNPPSHQPDQVLDFESWWFEGKSKRSVYLRFHIVEQYFRVAIDGDDAMYKIPEIISHKTGRKLGVWDLYVGAEVDIMGRITTLRLCSEPTAAWNAYWAEQLLELRDKLLSDLRKYDSRKVDNSAVFHVNSASKGAWNLRLLMKQVVVLNNRL